MPLEVYRAWRDVSRLPHLLRHVVEVREIDDRQIGAGECGPITRKLQDVFFEAVKGRPGKEKPSHPEWLTFV